MYGLVTLLQCSAYSITSIVDKLPDSSHRLTIVRLGIIIAVDNNNNNMGYNNNFVGNHSLIRLRLFNNNYNNKFSGDNDGTDIFCTTTSRTRKKKDQKIKKTKII